MNSADQDAQTITVNPTFWDLFTAALFVIPYQGNVIAFHGIFPVIGIFCLFVPFLLGQPFRPSCIVIAVLCFSFTPLVLAGAIYGARKNKLARGPFTYRFDDEGMHIAGPGSSQTIKWSGILQVRRTQRFLFVFIGPALAHPLSIKALREQGVLDQVCALFQKYSNIR